jgi:hypothetical protein
VTQSSHVSNRIWLLKREKWDYDDTTAMVIIAPTEAAARSLAAKSFDPTWDKLSGPVWLDPTQVTAEEVPIDSDPAILLEHIRYG